MEKGHIGGYTGNNTKLMGSPEIKYGGDIIDETAQDHEGSSLYRKSSSPLNQSMHKTLTKIDKKPADKMSMKSVMRSKSDLLHGGDFSDNYSFGDAFAAARSNVGHGGGYFTWQGNKYTTERADDVNKEGKIPAVDSISRKSSSPLNETYDHKMAFDRNEIDILKSDIHKDDEAKKHEGVSRKASPLDQREFPELPNPRKETRKRLGKNKKKKKKK